MEKIDPLKQIFLDNFIIKKEADKILSHSIKCVTHPYNLFPSKPKNKKHNKNIGDKSTPKKIICKIDDFKDCVNFSNDDKFSVDIFNNSIGFGTEIEIVHELSSTSIMVQTWIKYFNENKLYNDDLCMCIVDSDTITINISTIENIEYIRIVGVKI